MGTISRWDWIPSSIRVGVGRMPESTVVLPLAPVHERQGIEFRPAFATTTFPEGTAESAGPQVEIRSTVPGENGRTERLAHDYLVDATGPELNVGATPGLGPDGSSLSVCTASRAAETAHELDTFLDELATGPRQTIVLGTGHGTCTCEGASSEYTSDVEHELRERGVRAITGAHAQEVEPGVIHYEQLDGSERTQEFDLAMLRRRSAVRT